MLATYSEQLRLRTFKTRQSLPLQQDTLWLLKQGAVKTYTWNSEGNIITLGYWGAEDVVGLPLSRANPYQVQCLTSVEAICLSLSQWNGLSEAICSYIQQTEELLCIVRSEKMYQRMYKILVWLGNKFGRQTAAGTIIELPLTHQELAEVIGTTRVTVTRIINRLEQDGIISRPHRHSLILHS